MVSNYLGYMLADKGTKLPEALKMIRKAVEQEPMNGAYLDSLGWAYFKMGSTNWRRKICARPSSAIRPIPPCTSISAIFTRRPAAFAWQPRSGSFLSPSSRGRPLPTSNPPTLPSCSANSRPLA